MAVVGPQGAGKTWLCNALAARRPDDASAPEAAPPVPASGPTAGARILRLSRTLADPTQVPSARPRRAAVCAPMRAGRLVHRGRRTVGLFGRPKVRARRRPRLAAMRAARCECARRYEGCWPAITHGLGAVLVVLDAASQSQANDVALWSALLAASAPPPACVQCRGRAQGGVVL